MNAKKINISNQFNQFAIINVFAGQPLISSTNISCYCQMKEAEIEALQDKINLDVLIRGGNFNLRSYDHVNSDKNGRA